MAENAQKNVEKHSNVYYTLNLDTREFTAREKSVAVKNNFGADIFKFDGKIYDGRTGVSCCNAKLVSELLKQYDGKSEEWLKTLAQSKARVEERTGKEILPSPRYTRPNERKADVFPKPENDGSHILSPALYQKGKSWFTHVYSDDGVELYKEDKSKSTAPMLFTPCRGYMIGIGAGIENVVAFLTKEGFNIYDYIVEHFEKGLANPDGYADAGIGEFLGRRDEAINHNAPISVARNAERQAERGRREAEERAELARLRQEYETAINDAERAILDKRNVTEREIPTPSADGTHFSDKSLMLQLFRENGVELPLKTQGWVKKSLADIYYRPNREDWDYSYFSGRGGRASATFASYVNELAEAITEKYRAAELGDADDTDEREDGDSYDNDGELDEDEDFEM